MKLARVVILVSGALACAGGSKPGTAPIAPAATATSQAGAPAAVAAPRESVSRALLRRTIDSMVNQPQFRSSHFGVLIVDPEKGDTVYSLNAGKLFMPASNMKIVTGATSLAQLGADYTYRTTFEAAGYMKHDTLAGALIVTGRGDPTISDHMRGNAMSAFYDVADSLKAHGISAITDGIRAGPDVFPDTTIGFGWSWDDLGEDYGAGVDALYFNEGFGTLIARGKPGMRPDSVETAPATHYPNVMYTHGVASARADTGSLRLDFNQFRNAFFLVGKMKTAQDTLVYVYPSFRRAYLSALTEALESRGVATGRGAWGESNTDAVPYDPSRMRALFVLRSSPMREILPALLKPSQNQIAEILYKTLALEKTGVGSADSGRVVIERQLASWGAQPDGYLIRDGSGLSRYDYLSPETIVRVLDKVRADTAFHVFYDALPIAGVDGSLKNRMRGTAAAGNVHAKTGSIANARSLSGYVTTADNHTLIFSLLANNWIVKQSAVDSVQNRITVMMAELKLRDAQ
jgi:D-alanyl-D-alanine carboxypeptidase/D-alanyl-D-alanine-endopeptidase (penicillin-binding protein 4)